jgi:hypothetical protein
MEKLVYIVWKPEDVADEAFKTRLLGDVAPRLLDGGARHLKISVVDETVAPGKKLRIGSMRPPKQGMVSFWLEQAQERGRYEETLAAAVSRLACYLVVESRPLLNTTQVAPLGQRTPGFSTVTCIEPRPDLTHAQFIEKWWYVQRDVAIETQSTFSYVRNEVVRALSPEAPPWAAVVEEGFPIDALTDPMAFYDARGDKQRFQANLERMIEAVSSFLALDKVESHPMSEFVFEV